MTALGTRSLTMIIDGDEVAAQISKGVITSGEADSDFVTFADAASGGAREYRLEMEAAQDTAADTIWDKVWLAAGDTVACILRPYGNAVPSVAQPHFGFNAVITEPDGDFIGGEADASTTARQTFEVSWVLEAKPTRITAP